MDRLEKSTGIGLVCLSTTMCQSAITPLVGHPPSFVLYLRLETALCAMTLTVLCAVNQLQFYCNIKSPSRQYVFAPNVVPNHRY